MNNNDERDYTEEQANRGLLQLAYIYVSHRWIARNEDLECSRCGMIGSDYSKRWQGEPLISLSCGG